MRLRGGGADNIAQVEQEFLRMPSLRIPGARMQIVARHEPLEIADATAADCGALLSGARIFVTRA